MSDGSVLRQFTKNITNEKVTEYLTSFYKPLDEELGNMRREADKAAVPIILPEVEDFLGVCVDIVKPRRVLEIGTSIGYSSMFFAKKMQLTGVEDPKVFTIEKDEATYRLAERNVKDKGYSGCVQVLLGDGEEVIDGLAVKGIEKFDLVFIDAAKSHYKRFMEASLKILSPEGIIICDDTLFEGRPALDPDEPPRKHRTNVKALREFNEFVKNDPRFSAVHLSVGNGINLVKPVKLSLKYDVLQELR